MKEVNRLKQEKGLPHLNDLVVKLVNEYVEQTTFIVTSGGESLVRFIEEKNLLTYLQNVRKELEKKT